MPHCMPHGEVKGHFSPLIPNMTMTNNSPLHEIIWACFNLSLGGNIIVGGQLLHPFHLDLQRRKVRHKSASQRRAIGKGSLHCVLMGRGDTQL